MNAPQAAPLQSLQNPGVREASLPAVSPGFETLASFELMQRAARLLSASSIVPASYRQFVEKRQGQNTVQIENPNALANCVVALNMATRMKADPIMVMQNLYIVEGRPSWSSQWIIAAINGCGRFSPLRFEITDQGEQDISYTVFAWDDAARAKVPQTKTQRARNKVCIAWAIEKESGARIESPAVSIEMAIKEGWYTKNGSKWQTMDEVMLRYRAASFFGKLYAPEILMGLMTVEEAQDHVIDLTPDASGAYSVDISTLQASAAAQTAQQPSAGVVDQAPGQQDDAPVQQAEPEAPQQTNAASAEPKSEAEPQAGADTENHQGQSENGPAFTFNDAFNAVNSGDYELAESIAAHLTPGQRAQVEVAIKNRRERDSQGDAAASTAPAAGGQQAAGAAQAGTTTRPRRPRSNETIE